MLIVGPKPTRTVNFHSTPQKSHPPPPFDLGWAVSVSLWQHPTQAGGHYESSFSWLGTSLKLREAIDPSHTCTTWKEGESVSLEKHTTKWTQIPVGLPYLFPPFWTIWRFSGCLSGDLSRTESSIPIIVSHSFPSLPASLSPLPQSCFLIIFQVNHLCASPCVGSPYGNPG